MGQLDGPITNSLHHNVITLPKSRKTLPPNTRSFMSIFNLVQKRKKKTNVLLPNITLSKTKTERINFYRTNAINRICLNVVNEYN